MPLPPLKKKAARSPEARILADALWMLFHVEELCRTHVFSREALGLARLVATGVEAAHKCLSDAPHPNEIRRLAADMKEWKATYKEGCAKIRARAVLRVNQDYPLILKRKALAVSVWENGPSILSWGLKNWPDELDMLAMSVSDMVDHLTLAEAILEGCPKKIDTCSNLDTASRERIPEKAWEWISVGMRNGVYKKDLEKVAARKARRLGAVLPDNHRDPGSALASPKMRF